MQMADTSLQDCEQEVEQARAKLASDLATLRSPSTYTAFTQDLTKEKDALLGKAKSTAQATLSGVIEDVKAKAAANPAAALAIGAGVAWRLVRHPPIATALVGVGLFSLLRTQASPANEPASLQAGFDALSEQARSVASRAADAAADAGRSVGEKATDLVEAARAKLADVGEAASAKTAQVAEAARLNMDKLGSPARDAAQTAHDAVKPLSAAPPLDPGIAADQMEMPPAQDLIKATRDFLNDDGARDKLLLGVAAIAVTSALGMAIQRRMIGNERTVEHVSSDPRLE
jgi:ElaB/YqjD/DUF883 family membrane-anchored ribosome-binding protein